MAKVYLVNRPKVNKFGWTPDLSDASRYGSIEVVFEANEKPQFLIAVMIVCMIAAENSPIVRILRWERNIEEGDRDRRKGWYMPVALEMRKENNDNKSTR
jgi:hypothetical protein